MTEFITFALQNIALTWIASFLWLTSPVWIWFYLVYRADKVFKEQNT
tara:strand:- start:213 stop:353 length:141 start_codon:yes stop_codon:yes gene_type:complete